MGEGGLMAKVEVEVEFGLKVGNGVGVTGVVDGGLLLVVVVLEEM